MSYRVALHSDVPVLMIMPMIFVQSINDGRRVFLPHDQ